MADHNTTHELVDIDRLSRRLGLSKRYLMGEQRAGRIPSLRAGNRLRFSPEAVRRVLADRAAKGVRE